MRLSDLGEEYRGPTGQPDPEIAGITEDSRAVKPGWLFVAVPGTRQDGHAFVDDAIGRGAAALIVERPVGGARAVPAAVVASSRAALAQVAARFHGDPARSLRLIGFTGTFGKTTTSEVLRALLAAGGRRVGLIGSLGARYDGYADPGGGLTTPAPPALHRMLRELCDRGADTVVMEVTSHAMMLSRVEGLRFRDFVLAAIVPGEHTDFHRSYRDYVAAKARFLDYLSPDAVLAYDADNPAARDLAARADVAVRVGASVGRRHMVAPHDLVVADVELDDHGALLTVHGERMRSSLLGSVNVRAVALALAHALARDIDLRTARRALSMLVPPARRMQRFVLAGRTILDDIAAHPDNFRATFEVADLLPHDRLVVALAMRGGREVDINRRNALALADLALVGGAARVIVTPSADLVGAGDGASPEEIDATRHAFAERGCEIAWEETLAGAMRAVACASSAGDLVVLVGAQGMDEGARLLREAVA
jgi:UDP-N-acetylmuramoyl-L-alanyl-D-glutamate--2,6-diaminopimelate ligase